MKNGLSIACGLFGLLLFIIMGGWFDFSFLARNAALLETLFSIFSALISLALGAFSIVLSLGGKHILRKLKNFYFNKMFGVDLSLSVIIDRDYNELMILAHLINFYKENMAEYETEDTMYFPAVSCDVSHPKFRILQRLAEDWYVTDVTFQCKKRYEDMRQVPEKITEFPEARYFHINQEFAQLISPKTKRIVHPIEAYDGTNLPFGYEKYFVIL
jgi:hypothetical protein